MKARIVVLGVILVIFVAMIAAQPWADPPGRANLVECAGKAEKAKVRGIMLDGLDAALAERSKLLFEAWMKDASGQPDRARKGIEQGVDAYLHGRKALAAWDIPECP